MKVVVHAPFHDWSEQGVFSRAVLDELASMDLNVVGVPTRPPPPIVLSPGPRMEKLLSRYLIKDMKATEHHLDACDVQLVMGPAQEVIPLGRHNKLSILLATGRDDAALRNASRYSFKLDWGGVGLWMPPTTSMTSMTPLLYEQCMKAPYAFYFPDFTQPLNISYIDHLLSTHGRIILYAPGNAINMQILQQQLRAVNHKGRVIDVMVDPLTDDELMGVWGHHYCRVRPDWWVDRWVESEVEPKALDTFLRQVFNLQLTV